ncbi:uncharacterized protein LOC105700827 [Orussus abietinus]|uniref:uncharacterized protein LOC105700827 n=1 Tax=Orussus abietinus TaxID=222816 RepID=UPI0006264D28|nr:uncharacterized protein LOC105700827 [Orussus abietinus]
MGSGKSKGKGRGRRYPGRAQRSPESQQGRSSQDFDEVYEQDLRLLRRTIVRDPEGFILNNLMMCVQFFKNYEEEISHIQQTLVSSRETELNERLPPLKHTLLPDVLQEQVSQNVKFISMRQTSRPTEEPLQPVRIYVVMDNVEVTEEVYGPHYSSVNDAVTYNMLLKPSEHQGYVRLQRLEVTPSKKNPVAEDDVDLSSIAEDGDEPYSDNDSMFNMKSSLGKALPIRSKRITELSKSTLSRSLPDLGCEETEESLYDRAESHASLPIPRYPKRPKEEDNYSAGPRSSKSLSSGSGYSRGSHNRPRSSKAHPKNNPGQQTPNESPAGSTSSGYRSGSYTVDSDSDCGYATIKNNPIKLAKPGDTPSDAEIPPNCFKKLTYTKDGKIYDPKEERRQMLNNKQRRIKVALKRYNYDVWYWNSGQFMKHFIDLFVDHLAADLGFDQETVSYVEGHGAVIYCDNIDVFKTAKYASVESYEVIPGVWTQWPSCAQEWLYRPRGTWPTYEIIDKIKEFGCYAVPEGFVPKKEVNAQEDLEWQLTFPAAERFLETCLSSSQVRVYLIALMLLKIFIRPVNSTHGLATAHIRNQLFWLAEEDDRPSRWPENMTGECLLKLLNSLYHAISRNEPTLPDYFIKEKNLFQNIPDEYLLHNQKQLKRIIENPVMYVFHAMENIRHKSDKFFPRLDYEKLFRILTQDSEDALILVNPALARQIPKPLDKVNDYTAYDKEYDHPGGFWDNVKSKKDQQYVDSRKPVTHKTLINPKKAHDSIVEISVRCAELEGPRLSALLDFFIKHFIKMAECCHQYRASQQKSVYLSQADLLSVLLSEYPRFKDDAKAYRQKIRALKRKAIGSKSVNEAPETPRRNIDPPTFSLPLRERFTKESLDRVPVTLNMNKGSKEYDIESTSGYGYRSQVAIVEEKVVKAAVHKESRLEEHESSLPKTRKTPLEDKDASEMGPTGSRRVVFEDKDGGSKAEEAKSSEEFGITRPSEPEDASSAKKPHTVSIAKGEKDSFLTETTYI